MVLIPVREQGNTDPSHDERKLVRAQPKTTPPKKKPAQHRRHAVYKGCDERNVEVREQPARKFYESLFGAGGPGAYELHVLGGQWLPSCFLATCGVWEQGRQLPDSQT